MQFGQQVAVSQGEAVPVQKLPLGDGDGFSGVVVDLLGERRDQVVVQALELPQQVFLMDWRVKNTEICCVVFVWCKYLQVNCKVKSKYTVSTFTQVFLILRYF